jgi:hypothetical protein
MAMHKILAPEVQPNNLYYFFTVVRFSSSTCSPGGSILLLMNIPQDADISASCRGLMSLRLQGGLEGSFRSSSAFSQTKQVRSESSSRLNDPQLASHCMARDRHAEHRDCCNGCLSPPG